METELYGKWIRNNDGTFGARLLDEDGRQMTEWCGDDWCIPIGCGEPIELTSARGAKSIRYVNSFDRNALTVTVVDSPDDTDCARAGRHLNIKRWSARVDYDCTVYMIGCMHCGAVEESGSYNHEAYAECIAEFEDGIDHPEVGNCPTPKISPLWGQQ